MTLKRAIKRLERAMLSICLATSLPLILMSCIEWTTNSQGQLQSVGVPGAPIWQSETLAEQQHLASVGALGASPGSIVDSEAGKLVGVESDDDWLAEVNHWRTQAGTSPVGENPRLILGATEHARYLVKNGPKDAPSFLTFTQTIDGAAHTEDPANPYYTEDGYQAARTGDIGFDCDPVKMVDELVDAPFHRLSILAPWMRVSGYGDYGRCPVHAATLVVRGSSPVGLAKAVIFPPDNATVNGTMKNSEWPSPVVGCTGYSLPVGTPITLQMGAFVKVQLESYAIENETDGREVEACGFDALTYPLEQGRRILLNYGAVVVIPRYPLVSGNIYHVSIRTHRHLHTWSFHVSRSPRRITINHS